MFSEYRKAFAVLIVGAIGLMARFVPGVAGFLDPTAIDAIAVLAATFAAYRFENRAGGLNVTDLARIALENLLIKPDARAALDAAQSLAAGAIRPRPRNG